MTLLIGHVLNSTLPVPSCVVPYFDVRYSALRAFKTWPFSLETDFSLGSALTHVCVCGRSCGGTPCFRWATSRRTERARDCLRTLKEERGKSSRWQTVWYRISGQSEKTHFSFRSLAAAAHTEHYSFITTYFCSPFISHHMLREEIRGSFFLP